MLRVLSALLLLTTALAGCSDDPGIVSLDAVDQGTPGTPPPAAGPPVETEQPPAPEGEPVMTVSGVVNDEEARPVPGATVQLVALNRTRTTDAAGAFVFENVPVGFHVVRADATDFLAAEVTARPAGDGGTASVVLVLQRFAEEPYSQTVQFQGIMQCAAEYLIISPSCDTLLEAGGGPSVTQDETSFGFQVAPNWRTLVLDLDFDGDAHPGLDGLRVTVRGATDRADSGSYEQYARLYGASNYHLAPGGEYQDGTGPVPQNATAFQFEVYPHSHAYHPGGAGFLGVGVGLDVEFDLYATAFYVQGAPDGWSFLA